MVFKSHPIAVSSRTSSPTSNLQVRKTRSSLAWWLFAALWIIGFADVSGDFAVFAGVPLFGPNNPVPELRQQTQLISTVLIGLLALLGCMALVRGKCAYRAAPEIKLFLLFFGASTVFGVLGGLVKGVPLNYIIGDSRNFVTYLIVFAVGVASSERRVEDLRRLFLIGCGILLLKLFYSYGLNLALGAELSRRSLLKLSSFFAPMLFVTLGWVVYGKRATEWRRYAVLALLAAFGIFAAQARGLFLGTLAGALLFGVISPNHKRFYRLFILGLAILGIGLGAGIVLQGDITKSFGYWEASDETFAPGLEYRVRQVDALLTMFGNNWLAGAGLGSFDPTYEGYQDWLPRPYLVELEYLNLLAKLGVVGISLWIAAFFFLFVGCIRAGRRAAKPEYRGFVLGLTAGLGALMIASIVQTGYSSVYFHLYIVLILLVLSALRASQLQVRRTERSKDNYVPTT